MVKVFSSFFFQVPCDKLVEGNCTVAPFVVMKSLFARAKKFLAPKRKPLESPHQPPFAPHLKSVSRRLLNMAPILVIAFNAGLLWSQFNPKNKNSIIEYYRQAQQLTTNVQYVHTTEQAPPIPGYRVVQPRELTPTDFFLWTIGATERAEQYTHFVQKKELAYINYTEFFKQLKDVDSFLLAKHADQGLQKRVDFCNRGIELLKKIKDPLLKCRAITCLTSAFFAYSQDKAVYASKNQSERTASYQISSWANSVQESLIGGDGNGVVCSDFAAFAGYLAIKSGFPASDVAVLGMERFDKENKQYSLHAALNVKTDQGSIIIDPGTIIGKDIALSLPGIIYYFCKTQESSVFFSQENGCVLQDSVNMLGQTACFEPNKEQKNISTAYKSASMNPSDFEWMLDIYACAAEAYITRGGKSLEVTEKRKKAKAYIEDTRSLWSKASNIKSLMRAIKCAREKHHGVVAKAKKPSAPSGRAGRHRADLRM